MPNTTVLRVGGEDVQLEDRSQSDLRDLIGPSLAALLQTEHLSLLLGNGFTTGVVGAAQAPAVSMDGGSLEGDLGARAEAYAVVDAARLGRGSANIEDRIRALLLLLGGLRVLDQRVEADDCEGQLNRLLQDLVTGVLKAERGLADATGAASPQGLAAQDLLVDFLLAFAGRTGVRERLNLFTTNYDRFIEYGCDLAGLRPIDRFVGALEPVFRASRMDVDMHYSPPGIRGEPRYLEGVLHISKLHGSLDWRWNNGKLTRVALPFGADPGHPALPANPSEALIVYPNPAKDLETLQFPYAELLRDFSAALCRPNSVLFTFGYGFGDDHLNRIVADMLSIASTHLVIMSFDDVNGRIAHFLARAGRSDQISLLIGPELASLEKAVGLLPRVPRTNQTSGLVPPPLAPLGGDGAEDLPGAVQ